MTAQFKAGLTITTDASDLVKGAKIAEQHIRQLGQVAREAGKAAADGSKGYAQTREQAETASQATQRLTVASQANAAAQSKNTAAAQAQAAAQANAAKSILAMGSSTAAAAANLIKLNVANQAGSAAAAAIARGLDAEAQAARRAGEAARASADHLARLAAQKRAAQQAANQLAVASHRASRSLHKQAQSASLATTALVGLSGAAGAYMAVRLGQDIFRTGLAAEALRTRFEAAMGGIAEGRRELEYIRGVAERLGLELQSTARSYASLAAAARGTALEGAGARAVFEAWATSATALGLSAVDSERGLKALEQMISKGNVTAEELRQQLGDVLPGAFQTAAAAIGVTTQELNKMLEQGQVIATDFLPKFADALQDKFGDAAQSAALKANAEFNRFKTSLFDFRDVVAGGGFLDEITASMSALGETMSDPAVQQSTADLAAGIGSVTRFAAENSETIGLLAGSYVSYKVATLAAGAANRRMGATLVPMRAGFRLARAEVMSTTAGLASYRVAAIAAGTASRTAARGVRALTGAMARNPFGLATIAVTGLAASFLDLNTNIGRTDRLLNSQIEKLGTLGDKIGRINALTGQRKFDQLQYDLQTTQRAQNNDIGQLAGLQQDLRDRYGDNYERGIRRAAARGTNRRAFEDREALKEIRDLQQRIERDRLAILQMQAAMERAAYDGPDGPLITGSSGGPAGKKPKSNPFAEGLARYTQELADTEKLQRAGQISARYQQLQREEIEATTIARRLAQKARKNGFAITEKETLELKALISQMLGEKRALQEGIEARKKASRAAVETARQHARTGEQIRSEIARLKPSYKRDVAAAKRWRKEALGNLDATADGYREFADQVEEIYQSRLHQALQDDLERRTDWGAGVERVLAETQRKNNDWAGQAVETYRQVSQAAEDFFVGLVQGKATVADFVNFSIEQFARLAFQQAVQPGVDAAFRGVSNFTASLFGGGGAAAPVSGQFLSGNAGLAAMHGGGMVGRDRSHTVYADPRIFARADRYHGGGNIRPQGAIPGLRDNEVPIIAEANERVLTELQQANTARSFQALAESLKAATTGMLAGGRAGSGAPQVNINNYASDQVGVETRQGADGNLEFDISPLTAAVGSELAAEMAQGRGPLAQQLAQQGVRPTQNRARTF